MAEAEYIRWTPDLVIGVPTVDEQHRRIVDFINELVDAKGAAERSAVEQVLSGLVEYTVLHFSFEEELMEQASYPYLEAHRRIHELFVKKVQGYVARFQMREDITDELIQMLRQWLLQHIRTEDAHYKDTVNRHLNQEAVKQSGWLKRSLQRIFGGIK